MSKFKTAATAAMLAAGVSLPALAADADGKWISFGISTELQYDHVYSAGDGNTGGDLYTTIEPEFAVHFTPELYLRAGAVLEPVRDRPFGEDRYFEHHGLYLETLVLAYETDAFGVYGGKFTPVFGLHDFVPGMYGDLFAEHYELTERLGVGGSVTWAAENLGAATLHASVFTADRTVFSRSAFTDRGRTGLTDGGIGNTRSPRNVALALDFEPAMAENLVLRAAYLHQGAGAGDPAGQHAFELGGFYEFEVMDDLAIVPMIDWVRSYRATFDDTGTVERGLVQDVVTAGVGVEFGPWFGTAAGGLRFTDDTAGRSHDRFIQFSAGYAFDFGLAIEAGWVSVREEDIYVSGAGAKISYVAEF